MNSKFVIDTEVLKQIKSLAKLKKGKTKVPVFDHAKVEIVDDETIAFSVMSIDGNMGVTKGFRASFTQVSEHDTSFLIPISLINERKPGNKLIDYEFEEMVNHDRTRSIVLTYDGIQKKVGTLDVEHYPKFPIPKKAEKKLAIRWDMLERLNAATISAGKSETRPILTTVLIDKDKVISTDSHRLFVADNMKGSLVDEQVTLSAPFVKYISENEKGKFFGVLKQDHTYYFVESLDALYWERIVQGTYPDAEKLMSINPNYIFSFKDPKELKRVMTECAKLVKGLKNSSVVLTIKDENTVNLTARDEIGASIEQDLAIDGEQLRDTDFKIGFSSEYFLDAIKQVSSPKRVTQERIKLSLVGPNRPFHMHGDKDTEFAMLMPVRMY